MKLFLKTPRALIFSVLPLLLLSCGKKNEFAPPPPMPVGVESPIIRDQPTFFEFPGYLVAMKTVQIRARVKGILKTVSPDFKPGSSVKEGTLLFEIDETQYRAALDAAQANLAKAKADLNIAEITLKRRKTAAQAIAKIQLEVAAADVQAAEALVKSAEAQVKEAQDTLSWCKITAPFTGRISELLVDQFNLVGTDGATELCTMVNDDQLRVYFDINERAAITHLKNKKSEVSKKNPLKVTFSLADGSVYPHPATIDYADVQLNKETGVIRIRAIVPNPNQKLVAGLYVKVKLPNPDPGKNSILVPSIAIQRDLAGSFVLITTKDNKVQRANITLGQRIGHLRIVKSGLTGKESIIVQGFQRVQEGMEVSPRPISDKKEKSSPQKTSTQPDQGKPKSKSSQ